MYPHKSRSKYSSPSPVTLKRICFLFRNIFPPLDFPCIHGIIVPPALHAKDWRYPMFLINIFLLWILAVITVTDILRYKIPNYLLFWLSSAILMFLFPLSPAALFIRIFTAAVILFLLRLLHMPGGDCKLAVLFILLLGLERWLYALFLSCLLFILFFLFSLCVRSCSLKDSLPLGPFLNLGTLIIFISS